MIFSKSLLSKIFLVALCSTIAGLVVSLVQRSGARKEMSAGEKLRDTWAVLAGNQESAPWFGTLQLLWLFIEDMNISFDHESDWMPAKRDKLIHSQGAVTQFKFVPAANSTYSGVFASGASGILRASTAKQPVAGSNHFLTPGIAFKFFRDAVHSGNTITMFSLDGQDGGNFFENTLSNHVDHPADSSLKLVEKKFKTASAWPGLLGLSDLAKYDVKGQEVKFPIFPFRLFLEPSPKVKARIAKTEWTAENWLEQFKLVKDNDTLYTIYAEPVPGTTTRFLVGKIVAQGEFITSYDGDKSLFFQHVRMEDDLLYYPEWRKSLDANNGGVVFQK